jgi:hypothetical protein
LFHHIGVVTVLDVDRPQPAARFSGTALVRQIANSNNIGISVKFKPSLCNRSLHRILRFKDIVEFLELYFQLACDYECFNESFSTYSAILGLGHQQVDDARLNETPDQKDSIRLPLYVRQSDWETKLVDKSTWSS